MGSFGGFDGQGDRWRFTIGGLERDVVDARMVRFALFAWLTDPCP